MLREALLRLMEYDQDEIADQLLDELLLALDITTLDHEGGKHQAAPGGLLRKSARRC
ncbi:hypothetical protein HAALTHF_25210n [Vreelandella aquamarina]|nr:hypothetical protein HAALTHF_25210n [Halomonas axialensis]